jgi:hypothetical protein
VFRRLNGSVASAPVRVAILQVQSRKHDSNLKLGTALEQFEKTIATALFQA